MGSRQNLDVKGMFKTQITTEKGACTSTMIYIVNGFHPEPLLVEEDEEPYKQVRTIPSKLRHGLNVTVQTAPPKSPNIPDNERRKCLDITEEYIGTVFHNKKVGQLQRKPAHLDFNENFKPTQQNYRPISLHYREKLSKLLKFLREEDVIEDVDPNNTYDCILNVVITDKNDGDIRMNIDATTLNEGMSRTKYHIQTAQEIRHELKEATMFSEMDMGWGYHQLEIDQETSERAVFQTHKGLHRMKRLYFGPSAATGIFHKEGTDGAERVYGRSQQHSSNRNRCKRPPG
jgi:hypothetical protein